MSAPLSQTFAHLPQQLAPLHSRKHVGWPPDHRNGASRSNESRKGPQGLQQDLTAEDARNALTAVIGAMAAGEITSAEAAEAMRPIQLFLETLVLR